MERKCFIKLDPKLSFSIKFMFDWDFCYLEGA